MSSVGLAVILVLLVALVGSYLYGGSKDMEARRQDWRDEVNKQIRGEQ